MGRQPLRRHPQAFASSPIRTAAPPAPSLLSTPLKLSQIAAAGAPPAFNDTVVSVSAGNNDLRYTVAQLLSPTPLASNLNVFVNPATGNDNNPGTSSGAPFATLKRALVEVGRYDYQRTFTWSIKLADGTYPESGRQSIPAVANPTIQCGHIVGNGTTPGNVHFTNSGGFIFNPATYECNIGGLQLDLVGGGQAFLVANGGGAAGAEGGLIFNADFNLNLVSGNWTLFAAASGALFDASTLANVNITGTGCIQVFYGEAGGNNNWDGPGLTFNFPASFPLLNAFANFNTGSKFVWIQIGVTNNPGGGIQLESGATVRTTNGTVADIPGGFAFGASPGFWEGGSANQGTYLAPNNAGGPTTSFIPNQQGWNVVKDTTNGPRTLAFNDGGILYTKQIGNNVNLQSGASYTLQLFDQEGIVEMNNAAANTLTVPPNSAVAFPVGTKISVEQVGAGLTTIAAGTGVTVHNVGALAGQFKTALLRKRGTNEWTQTNGAF